MSQSKWGVEFDEYMKTHSYVYMEGKLMDIAYEKRIYVRGLETPKESSKAIKKYTKIKGVKTLREGSSAFYQEPGQQKLSEEERKVVRNPELMERIRYWCKVWDQEQQFTESKNAYEKDCESFRKGDHTALKKMPDLNSVSAEVLCKERNELWIDRIEKVLNGTKIPFIAVGCRHLSGEHGLFNMLKQRGWKLIHQPSGSEI